MESLEFVEWLAKNPWLVVTSYVIGILGVVLAVVFYYKSRKVKSPLYASKTTNIISARDLAKNARGLEIFFRGEGVENLSVTRVAFWNGGSDTINYSDVPSSDPIVVCLREECRIFEASVDAKKAANEFGVSIDDPTRVRLLFDYIDKNDSAILRILHTGTSSLDVQVKGSVKGAGPLKNALGIPIGAMHSKWPQPLRYAIGLVCLLFASVLGLVAILFLATFSLAKVNWFNLSTYVGPLMWAILELWSIVYGISHLRSKMPLDLDSL